MSRRRAPAPAAESESRLSSLARWLSAALAALIVVFIGLSLSGQLTITAVRSEAMAPTIAKGERLLALRGFKAPELGDIVIFRTRGVGDLGDGLLALRVAGRPGDQLELREGVLYVNGTPAPLENVEGKLRYRSFATAGYLNAFRRVVTVPQDRYFFLSDNPASNNDSRFWGFVPAENLRGRVRLRLWPMHRWGGPR